LEAASRLTRFELQNKWPYASGHHLWDHLSHRSGLTSLNIEVPTGPLQLTTAVGQLFPSLEKLTVQGQVDSILAIVPQTTHVKELDINVKTLFGQIRSGINVFELENQILQELLNYKCLESLLFNFDQHTVLMTNDGRHNGSVNLSSTWLRSFALLCPNLKRLDFLGQAQPRRLKHDITTEDIDWISARLPNLATLRLDLCPLSGSLTDRVLESLGRNCRSLKSCELSCAIGLSFISLKQPPLFPGLVSLGLLVSALNMPADERKVKKTRAVLMHHFPRLRQLKCLGTVDSLGDPARGGGKSLGTHSIPYLHPFDTKDVEDFLNNIQPNNLGPRVPKGEPTVPTTL